MEKRFGLMFGFLLAFVVLAGFASAATINATSIPSPVSIQGTTGSFQVTVLSDTTGNATISIPNLVSGFTSGVITFSSDTVNVTANVSTPITVHYNVSDPDSYFNFLQSYSQTMTLSFDGVSSNTYSINFKNGDYCNGVANTANVLRVNQPDFTIESGYGDSDNWYLLNNISAKVLIENNNNNLEVRNVKVEWALYTVDGSKIESGSLSTFKLNSGEDKTVTINFQLDRNFNKIDNSGKVMLFVKASGTINNPDSPYTYDGNESCSFYQNPQQVRVETGDDFMIPTDITINGNLIPQGDVLTNPVACGSTINFGGTVYNIGSNDQDSGSYVIIYNRELGLNKIVQLGSINGFDSQSFSSSFQIPKDVAEKTYQVQFSVYDTNNDLFENSQSDQAVKNTYFTVQGGCKITDPTLTVNLDSTEVVAGKEMVVKVNVRNNDVKNATFTISADGFSNWANLKTVDPQNFVLGSGQSKDIYLTFDLLSSSAGDQTFNLIVTGNNYVLANKPVSVTVQEGSVFSNLFKNFDWTVWGIIILNLILLIAIIIVARRVLKRR